LSLSLALIVLWTVGIQTAQAAQRSINAYYAIDSYGNRAYTKYADQVALAWAEIRQKDGHIYYTQQKKEKDRAEAYDYGIPQGFDELTGLVNEMKVNGNQLKLSIFLGDGETLKKLLNSPEIQQRIVQDIVSNLYIEYIDYSGSPDENGFFPRYPIKDFLDQPIQYDGIIIDFEGLTEEQGQNYSQKFNRFLDLLRQSLPADKTLGVCIPPKRSGGIAYYNGYDYKHIGMVADEVLLMAHDYQWKDKNTIISSDGRWKVGSIVASAPYNLVEEAIQLALRDIPADKLLLQISLNPIQWTYGKENYSKISYTMMLNALDGKNPNEKVIKVTPREQRYDENLKVGHAKLEREILRQGQWVTQIDEFYFENQKSIEEKQKLVEKYNLKGLSFWRLGLGTVDTLDAIFKTRMMDFNGDGRIDSSDLTMAAGAFGKLAEDPGWDPAYDMNGDGVINLLDLSRVSKMVNPFSRDSSYAADESVGEAGKERVGLALPSNDIDLWEEFPVKVYLAGINDFYGASVELVYDPSVLRITEVLPGDVFGDKEALAVEHVNYFDNDSGTFRYVKTLTGDTGGVRADGTLMVIKFKAVNPGQFAFKLTQNPLKLLGRQEENIRVLLCDSYGQQIHWKYGDDRSAAIVNRWNRAISRRISGSNRFYTAAAVSQEGWTSSETVLLATGKDGELYFPDALAGGPLAKLLDAPILLTPPNRLHPVVEKEIERLGAKRVYILGGPAVVEEEVVTELRKKGLEVERLAGSNRYETAAKIAELMKAQAAAIGSEEPKKVIITTGESFQYPLSVASFAAQRNIPLLFAKKDSLTKSTMDAIRGLGIEEVDIVGDTGVLSAELERELKSLGVSTVTRIAGEDRTQTLLKAAEYYSPNPSGLAFARNDVFADALTGAALIGREGIPILLINPSEPEAAVLQYLEKAAATVQKTYIFGGTGAISDPIWYLIMERLIRK